ncbi:MAG: hypothetical protein ABIA11_02500 [Patescibacteria group bacterium]
MKMSEANKIIERGPSLKGYRVSFEKKTRALLFSNYFPEDDEPMIPTEDEAWEIAQKFAEKSRGIYVNIYITDQSYNPVKGYQTKIIRNM